MVEIIKSFASFFFNVREIPKEERKMVPKGGIEIRWICHSGWEGACHLGYGFLF